MPEALTLKVALLPAITVRLVGGAVIDGGTKTVRVATLLVAAWLYLQWTTPDCGFCDDAASSVSNAPGP